MARFYEFGEDRRYLITLAVIVATYALEGPMRWLLNMVHLEMLVYLRDLAAAAMCGFVIASWLAGQAAAFPFVVMFALLLVHFALGVLQLGTAWQAALGLKTFLAFLTGVIVAPLIAVRPRALFWGACAVFWITVAGVALNVLIVDLPWMGLSYETAFGQATAARMWNTAGGAVRLPGFSRASFSAAALLLVTMVPMLAAPMQLWRKAVVFTAAVVSIYLTTTKGALSSAGAFLLIMPLAVADRLTLAASNLGLVLLWLLCLCTPLFAVHYGAWNDREHALLTSFRERIADMWPRAFKLLETPAQHVYGRGLGGIGTPQEASGDWLQTNAADNFFVYVLVVFGWMGVAYCLYAMWRIMRYLSARPAAAFMPLCVRGWVTIWLSYGLTTNMVEEASLNTVIGIVVGLAFVPHRELLRIEDPSAA